MGCFVADASNAFNSLNRTVMLLHACVLRPRCSHFLFNPYYGWSVLVLQGSADFCIAGRVLLRVIPYQCFWDISFDTLFV